MQGLGGAQSVGQVEKLPLSNLGLSLPSSWRLDIVA